MLVYPNLKKFIVLAIIFILIGLNSCAYYNTFYNAEQYFMEAQKLTRENQTENVSREEINLYSKAIEKSKKLLQRYPDSKYRDDAQFVIAKSYYFKGDFLLAKRYFENLSLDYGNSPHAKEVPLWIGRCLFKTGDLEMARHEASRITRGTADRGLQADALLLMGEIAVQQDSLSLAENYLRQVIERSPDGYTKAQAQFQVGRMRESESDFEGALKAFQTVSRYKPSESLKVEAIIRQTSMLKALNRDGDAVEMIQEMLLSDKFVDIRGQLEVELGKLYLVMGQIDLAEEKLKSIISDYGRQEEAAEASFVLGELYLIEKLNYEAARQAYADIKSQFARSPFVQQGTERIKLIDRYLKLQLDYSNLQLQLAGLPPRVKENAKTTNKGRADRSSNLRGRTRGAKPGDPDQNSAKAKQMKEELESADIAAVEVSQDDSVRFFKMMDANRYALAEYMLFEFVRIDTTLDILGSLELNSADSAIKQQSAYMQYYALESVRGDKIAGQKVLEHIQQSYPDYYATIWSDTTTVDLVADPNEDRYRAVAPLFEAGSYAEASARYFALKEDSTVSLDIRGKSCYNHAWLNDHFLFDKTAALESYNYLLANFPDDPLALMARNRLNALTMDPVQNQQSHSEEPQDEDVKSDKPAAKSEKKSSEDDKQGKRG
ncbi:MAG: tetratricopeptide repeat protein [Candidatus Marinimicrobia bacterium]|nr:tetratricopeptide repeat protein [Candidatus Neomarinimicrobiota bacterium]